MWVSSSNNLPRPSLLPQLSPPAVTQPLPMFPHPSQIGIDNGRKTLLITREVNEAIALAGRNIEKLAINTADMISVFDVLNADKIIIEHAALEHINAFYGVEEATEETAQA